MQWHYYVNLLIHPELIRACLTATLSKFSYSPEPDFSDLYIAKNTFLKNFTKEA